MDRDKDGFVTSEDFCRYLAVPSDACTLAVFSALSNEVYTQCYAILYNTCFTLRGHRRVS